LIGFITGLVPVIHGRNSMDCPDEPGNDEAGGELED